MTPRLKLYHYWRSTSSWRVRWAFALKNIPLDCVAVDLLNGESESEAHLRRNPLGYVPVLEIPSSVVGGGAASPVFLSESMAIMEWAEENYPTPALLPGDSISRARIRQLAEIINADTQPLQNLNPQFLHSDDPEKRKKWAQHWIRHGLGAYEKIAAPYAGEFSVGNQLTLADLCLVPQCYNAGRYEIDLGEFPTVARIQKNAQATASYAASHPDRFTPKPSSV